MSEQQLPVASRVQGRRSGGACEVISHWVRGNLSISFYPKGLDESGKPKVDSKGRAAREYSAEFKVKPAQDSCGCCVGYVLTQVGGKPLQERQRVLRAVRYAHAPRIMYLVDTAGEVDPIGPIVLAEGPTGKLVAFYDRGDNLPGWKGTSKTPVGAMVVLRQGRAAGMKGCLAQFAYPQVLEPAKACACSRKPYGASPRRRGR